MMRWRQSSMQRHNCVVSALVICMHTSAIPGQDQSRTEGQDHAFTVRD